MRLLQGRWAGAAWDILMVLPIAEEVCIGEQTVIFLSDVIDVNEYLGDELIGRSCQR